MPGSTISPGCSGDMVDAKFYSCPRAVTNAPSSWVKNLFDLYRFTEGKIHNLTKVPGWESPSAALCASLEELGYTLSYVKERQAEMHQKALELQNAADAARRK